MDAGRRIAKYELVEAIGEGGMAVVYRARLCGPGEAKKEVALKLISAHLRSDPDYRRLFLNELQVSMGLSHRNIVQTFDAGCEDLTYYMVMELVVGCSLSRMLRQIEGRELLPLDIVLFIACEVAAALEYAHGADRPGEATPIVHRDVSPGNILLSAMGDVKLADFGVAKALHGLGLEQSVVTGKLPYMAPEQARGRAEPSSDLFSLGVVLREMLTGVRPTGPLADSDAGSPMPPLTSTRPHLPATVEALTARCLSPDPAARPASAAALQAELRDILFDIQVGPEPHRRLREYLVGRSLANSSSRLQSSGLANALIDQARRVPSLRRDLPEASASLGSIDTSVEPTARAPQRSEGQPAEVGASPTGSLAEAAAGEEGLRRPHDLPRPARRARAAVASALVLLLSIAAAIWVVKTNRFRAAVRPPAPRGSATGRTSPAPALSAGPAARARADLIEGEPSAKPSRSAERSRKRRRAPPRLNRQAQPKRNSPPTAERPKDASRANSPSPGTSTGAKTPSPVPKKQLRYQEL